MSDFGSLIEVKSLDGQNIEAQDHIQLEQAIQIIQSTDKHEDVSGEPFSFKISLSNDISGVKNIAIILSEYWLEGVDGGDYNIIISQSKRYWRQIFQKCRLYSRNCQLQLLLTIR
jgi:hypothetical protein